MPNKHPLSMLFILLLLFIPAHLAGAKNLADLQKEAITFEKDLKKEKLKSARHDQAALLYYAAGVMQEQKKCDEAVTLYRQSVKLGRKVNSSFWHHFTLAAFCAEQWKQASFGAYLAYDKNDSHELQGLHLLQLAKSLESRSNWQGDWKPVAIKVYDQYLALADYVDDDVVQKKVNSLKRNRDYKKKLRVKNSYASTNLKSPELCLDFNEHLQDEDQFSYQDYVKITPQLKADFSVNGPTLCIPGADFGASYEVVVLKGLKGSQKILPETKQYTIKTGHLTSSVWFNRNMYVLPKTTQSGISLHTINIKEINLQLYRIHERNILSSFVQRKFQSKLSGSELNVIGESIGESVWQGAATIEGKADRAQANLLQLPEDILAEPGLYVLTAQEQKEDEKYYSDKATQWLVVSDIGLTTYIGTDGLTVVARSLETAKPLSGITVTLQGKNNAPLSTVVTDSNGLAHIGSGLLQGKGGRKASLLVAHGPLSGFTFLQLYQAAFDLSDRGVSGRPVPGPVDGYMYTDRGIYRPGETVNGMALVRGAQGETLNGLPLTLRVLGPDNKIITEKVLQPDASGAYAATTVLSDYARTGNWTMALYVDVKDSSVAETSFQVQAFVPPRIEVSVKPRGVIKADNPASIDLQADYLFGAPAADLQVTANIIMQYDPHPFGQYPGFHFGRKGEDVQPQQIYLEDSTTDKAGHSTIICRLDELPITLQPLKAKVQSTVTDIDGRAVSAEVYVPVRFLENYIGVQPHFADNQAQSHKNADFNVIVLDKDGQPLGLEGVSYRLFKEEVEYQWFRRYSEWGYERIVNERDVEEDGLVINKNGQAGISVPLGAGIYGLELYGPGKQLLTSIHFSAGEQIVDGGNSPDAVKMELDRPQYQAGDVARLKITAPYSGEVTLVLASSSLHSISNHKLDSNTREFEIPVQADWQGGAYALVTVYRPGVDSKKGAGRAVGIIWISIDPKDHRLNLALNIPERARPRQVVEIPVTVQGSPAGEEIHLTLAAVDEGVLQLTNFASPDPIKYFFAKQRLGTELRDLYGNLIKSPDSKPLVLRQGAGDPEESHRGAPVSNVRVVSLFSGIVKVGPDGIALVPFNLPDFNGKLRLMAVAWSGDKTGAASGYLPVSDPVVVAPSLPRFLALGDTSIMNVLLHNVDGPDGKYELSARAVGAVKIDGSNSFSLTLEQGKRQSLDFQLVAAGIGSGELQIELKGPDEYHYSGTFPLNTRGKNLPLLTRTFLGIKAGQFIDISNSLISGLYSDSASVDISFSSSPNLDVPGLLGQLDRYPYGCLEQLTSRAMPLLYANTLAERWQYPVDDGLNNRIDKAIELISQKQIYDGNFGLWSDAGPEEPWLTAYALDFFVRAKNKGFEVSDYIFAKGLERIKSRVQTTYEPQLESLAALSYFHYVLAMAGQGKPEEARYLFDNYLTDFPSSFAVAHLSGALALMGDKKRGEKGFKLALSLEAGAKTKAGNSWNSYGSPLRDLAGVIRVLYESGPDLADPASAWERLTRMLGARKYLSTQEQNWLVMAAMTLDEKKPLQLLVDGEKSITGEEFVRMHFVSSDMTEDSRIINQGKSTAWAVVIVRGTPVDFLPSVSGIFKVDRSWMTTGGDLLDEAPLQQGDLVVVLVEGTVQSEEEHRLLLVDLLPAGLEFEKTLFNSDDGFPWLPDLSSTRYEDGLDDRFVAAIDTGLLEDEEGVRSFKLAYLLRAVTPGSYSVAPTEIEDMYQPRYRARTEADAVVIEKRDKK